MQIPDWKTEKKLWEKGCNFVVGIDEAGRGPLAGPVVASAVVLKNRKLAEVGEMNKKVNAKSDKYELVEANKLIRDSKTLSEKQRERAFKFVQKNFLVGVGICNEKTIDRINILEASFLAMKMAVIDLKKKLQEKKIVLLVDGNKIIPNFTEKQKAIIQGDKKVKSIAAASIIAKVTRDKIMKEYDKKYPEYGFAKHKGYGTKIHMEALQKFGPCEIHRRSFAPVKMASSNK